MDENLNAPEGGDGALVVGQLNPFARIVALERALGRMIEATEHPSQLLASAGWSRINGAYVHPEVVGRFLYRDEAVIKELHRRVHEAKALLGIEL